MNQLMTAATHRHLPLPGTYNVRDLGGYAVAGGGSTQWRRILRADALHKLDAEGRALLREAGLRTLIDLRFDQEVKDAPSPFPGDSGIVQHRISLFEALIPHYGDFRELKGEDPLAAFYASALEHCRDDLGRAVATVIDAPDGMVLYHCTAGKDRTGLVSAMLLLAVGVDPATIEEDYALTAKIAGPMFEAMLKAAAERGDDIERMKRVLGSDATTMRATIAHIAERYGSAASYLAGIGVGEDRVERLHKRLVAA